MNSTLSRSCIILLSLAAFAVLPARAMASRNPDDGLERIFREPPPSARPNTWWFWGESVTTDEGITRDLEAMKRVGYGGVVVYEQVFGHRTDAYKTLSPDWLARSRHAAAECARLGLTLEANAGDGYVAGGTWITPELGMQRLVSSELVVTGGKRLEVALPHPPVHLNWYRDVAVLACPAPAGAEPLPPPRVTCDAKGLDARAFFDPAARHLRIVPATPGRRPVHLVLDYGGPRTVRSLAMDARVNRLGIPDVTLSPLRWDADYFGYDGHRPWTLGRLEAGDDGATWRPVCDIPAFGMQMDGWLRHTTSFAAVTARYFRLTVGICDGSLMAGRAVLSGVARVDQWEGKSGNVAMVPAPDRTPDYAPDEAIDPGRVVDLTDRMSPDGTLRWDAPPGRWLVLRFGHTPTGVRTKHGRPEGLGLECDKLSAHAAEVQFANYAAVLAREAAKAPGGRLAGIGLDSAEHGSQNWTGDFEAQFLARRGYAMRRLLPAMAGYVTGSAARSGAFLKELKGPWDVRFQPGRGAPERLAFPELVSWGSHPDAGVRGFSGAATYSFAFDFASSNRAGRVVLDLGDLSALAEVRLNGKSLGVVWQAPYAVDVTDALHGGTNALEIRVVNTWRNRLVADAALPPEKRLAWTTFNPYRAGSAPEACGLLGPVVLRRRPD